MEDKRFKKNDSGFICVHCGFEVPPSGVSSRNHCTQCLYSLHVDIFPGDRKNPCKGPLRPVGIELNSKKGYIILYRCEICNEQTKNKAAEDDSMDKIIEISAAH